MMNVFGDAQTTITSLAAGVGGVASSAIGDYIISQLGGGSANGGGFGMIGLEFAGRAVISSAVFAGLAYLLPQTSENVFFSILFFAADRGLMGSALSLSTSIVGAIKRVNKQASPNPRAYASQQAAAQPSMAKSSCGSCN